MASARLAGSDGKDRRDAKPGEDGCDEDLQASALGVPHSKRLGLSCHVCFVAVPWREYGAGIE